MLGFTVTSFLFFVLAGSVVGFFAGFFGVGGGILMVPLLVFSYEYSGLSPSILTHLAIGTSLFVIIFASIMSAYQHNRQRTVNWRAVLIIGFSSALTALGTARFAAALRGKHLQVVFAMIVVIAVIRMLTESQIQAQKKLEITSQPRAISLAGIGFATGIVSALGGVGGGLVIIPMMYNLLNYPLKLAIGTSSATIVITAFFSLVGYTVSGLSHPGLPRWTLGYVDLWHGAALAIGSIFFSRVGAYASFKTHPFRLRKAFIFFTLIVLTYMLLK
ncbi:MAG TPA: sulfite exporter TauE/SafE family protein [Thermodesulfobacteriota bacterium]|nr:sulfite exporter TauE/SafE family protein [Thermodesulfobacteriota bacterium]